MIMMNTNSGERQVGRKAQLSNIAAAKTYVQFYPIAQLARFDSDVEIINTVLRTLSGHVWVPRPC